MKPRANIIIFVILLVASTVPAADLTSGHIFTPGEQNITHVEMNAIVGGATINTAFFTDKSSLTPAASDVFLYYSVANTAFRKTTLNTLLLGNSALITGQSEDGSPAANDFLLTYDTSGGTLRKVSVQNLIVGTTNLFLSFPQITTPDMGDFIGLSHGVTNAKVSVSDFLLLSRTNFDYTTLFAGLPTHTAPTNQDSLLIYDRVNGTNKQISLIALYTNLPTIAAIRGDDVIPLVQTGTNLAKATFTTISNQVVSGMVTTNYLPLKYSSGDFPLPNQSHMTNLAHGLPATPQSVKWVIVCSTAEAGFAVGDQVPAADVWDSAGGVRAFATGVNATNVFVIQENNPRVMAKDNTGAANLTPANWRFRIEAIYFP